MGEHQMSYSRVGLRRVWFATRYELSTRPRLFTVLRVLIALAAATAWVLATR